MVKEEKDYLSIYFSLVRNYVLPTETFSSGKYRAELEVVFNEKEDIPESRMVPKPDIFSTFEFLIP